MRPLLLATLGSLIALPGLAAADTAAEAKADQLGANIEEGTLPARNAGVEWGYANAVMDAPLPAVRRIVTDYERYRDFLPHFEESRVLSRRGENALVYLEAHVVKGTVTLWAQMKIFARKPRGETRIIEARMLDGNMHNFVGRWELTPVDGGARTLVSFRILVDPGLPLPDSVFANENRKSARKTLKALRRRLSERTALASR